MNAALERVAALDDIAPGAVRLATLVSPAVRVEPALLRAARLRARLDASAESDLWFSDLVSAATFTGLSLEPTVADVLRQCLGSDPDDLALAGELLRDHHGREPWSIRLEERINLIAAAVQGNTAEAEQLLQAAVAELARADADDPAGALGIARWLLAALGRLPAATRVTSSAAAAGLAASLHLDGRLRGLDELDDTERARWLPGLLSRLGATTLPVRLTRDGVVLGGYAAFGLDVPATDPLVVTVRWQPSTDDLMSSSATSFGLSVEEVRLSPGQERLVAAPVGKIEIHALDGSGASLIRVGTGTIRREKETSRAFHISESELVTVPAAEGGAYLRDDYDGPERPLEQMRSDAKLGVATAVLLDDRRPGLPVAAAPPGARWRVGLDPARPPEAAGILPESISPINTLQILEGRAPEPGSPVILERPFGAVVAVVTGGRDQSVDVTSIFAVIDRFGLDYRTVQGPEPVHDARASEDLLRTGLDDGRLPVLSRVDPEALGVDASEPYVARQEDERLAAALGGPDPVVLVAGSRLAGKTRTAFEIVRRLYPEARVAAPRQVSGAMNRLAVLSPYINEPGLVVVWVDDARWFIDEGQLAAQTLDGLFNRVGRTILLGTITATPGGPSAHPRFGLAREIWLDERPPRSDPPSRQSRDTIPKRYADLVGRQFGCLPVWPLGANISVGDLGRLEGDRFVPMARGSDRGLTPDVELIGTVSNLQASDAGSTVEADESGRKRVRFGRPGGALVAFGNCSDQRLVDERSFADLFTWAWESSELDGIDVVVTRLFTSQTTLVLVAGKPDAEVVLEPNDPRGADPTDLTHSPMQVVSSRNMDTTVVSAEPMAVLVQVLQVRRTRFAGRFEVRREPEGSIVRDAKRS